MKIFVFGNPDFTFDSLPLRILPELKKKFPGHDFLSLDPNEEWYLPAEVWIIDTVMGISQAKLFSDLEEFVQTPRLTLHDFDALMNLRYLKKLGKLGAIKIIGLPPMMSEQEACAKVAAMLPAN